MSVAVALTRVVVAAAEDAGLPRAELASAAGLDVAVLDSVDGRVPHATHLAVWREADARLADADFGLRVAERLVPEAYGVVG